MHCSFSAAAQSPPLAVLAERTAASRSSPAIPSRKGSASNVLPLRLRFRRFSASNKTQGAQDLTPRALSGPSPGSSTIRVQYGPQLRPDTRRRATALAEKGQRSGVTRLAPPPPRGTRNKAAGRDVGVAPQTERWPRRAPGGKDSRGRDETSEKDPRRRGRRRRGKREGGTEGGTTGSWKGKRAKRRAKEARTKGQEGERGRATKVYSGAWARRRERTS